MTNKQSAFIDEDLANNGNGVQAAKAAGYKGSYNVLHSIAVENLQKPTIQTALETRKADITKKNELSILSKLKLQAIWSAFVQDSSKSDSDRLRASELLGKSRSDFPHKSEVKQPLSLEDGLRKLFSEISAKGKCIQIPTTRRVESISTNTVPPALPEKNDGTKKHPLDRGGEGEIGERSGSL